MMEENLMERHRNKSLYLKNNYIADYIVAKCGKTVDIQIVSKLCNCAALTYAYDSKYIILLAPNDDEKMLIFTILHELSHIQLGFLGEKYEKKTASSPYEKIVNINLIIKNIRLFNIRDIPRYVVLALISEENLVKKIKFKENKRYVCD